MSAADILPRLPDDEAMDGDPVLYWNRAALDMNRLSQTVSGPQGGPTMGSRALGIVHLAIHDAFFSIRPPTGHATYLDAPGTGETNLPNVPNGGDAALAIAGAAYESLATLYGVFGTSPASMELRTLLNRFLDKVTSEADRMKESFKYGEAVASKILNLLAVPPSHPGAAHIRPEDGYEYKPKPERGKYRLDPSNPTVPSHGPFYGETRKFAVQHPHVLGDPPALGTPDYLDALKQVYELGGKPGASTTTRTPDQTVRALFWAYDGVNLIGTPPRLYNLIVRRIAWGKKKGEGTDTADFARLFALVNTAMADAGIIAWSEKYYFEYWRPLSGIREHDPSSGPLGTPSVQLGSNEADPFWESHGAPRTNAHGVSFKPPFPAYPSGHATFGAAAFQIVRHFYAGPNGLADRDLRAPDTIGFDFVSEELNGNSRELYAPLDLCLPLDKQAGYVRTRVNRKFDSLWDAITDNGLSRIYLGVHWRFDAFLDSGNSESPFKTGPRGGNGQFPIGGVPLGLDIADDIFKSGLIRASAAPTRATAPAASAIRTFSAPVNLQDTNIR